MLEYALAGRDAGILSQLIVPLQVRSAVVLAVGVVVVDDGVLVVASRSKSLGLAGRSRRGHGLGLRSLDNGLRLGGRGRGRRSRGLSAGGLGLLGGGGVGDRRWRSRRSSRLGGDRLDGSGRGRLGILDEVGRFSGDGDGDDLDNPVGGGNDGAGRGDRGGEKSKRGLHFVKVGIENAKPGAEASVSLRVARGECEW